MDKPNNPKCSSCFVTKNTLRCSMCKYKTEEWLQEHISSVMFIANDDCYKERTR